MTFFSPEQVLSFWFDDTMAGSLDSIKRRMALWFARSSQDFEDQQFSMKDLVEAVGNETISDPNWVEDSPTVLVAKVILMDQFSRSIFRGTANAFRFDEKCALLAKKIIDQGWFFSKLSVIERFFVCVCLQHSENINLQKLGLDNSKLVAQGAPEDIANFFGGIKGFPEEHYNVVRQFGRFPHRNALLVCSVILFLYCINFILLLGS